MLGSGTDGVFLIRLGATDNADGALCDAKKFTSQLLLRYRVRLESGNPYLDV